MLLLIVNLIRRLSPWVWRVILQKYAIRCGKNVSVFKPVCITPQALILGNDVIVYYGARLEGVSSYETVKYSPEITISDHVNIQQNLHLPCAERVFIGSNTSVGANVTITDIHHPYTDVDLPIERQILEVTPVYIGDDCKIYNNSVILPGTYLGKHCTVGANSVVSGIFPDFSVIVGIPARIVKRYDFSRKKWRRTNAAGDFIESHG